MISNFVISTPGLRVEKFLRSVMISEVGGCNSPVEQSGEYNPNWSYLIVTSLTFPGHLLPTQT